MLLTNKLASAVVARELLSRRKNDYIVIKRPWKTRLFSLPWKPWVKYRKELRLFHAGDKADTVTFRRPHSYTVEG